MTTPIARYRKRFKWCACLIAAIVFPAAEQARAAPWCEGVVLSGDPDYPPFSWYDGKTLHGAAIEIVGEALERIRLPYEIRYVGPFARLLLEAKIGKVDIIAELKNTADRQAFLEFSKTAVFVNPIAIFTRKDSSIQFHRWEDLRGLRGGITNANKFGGGFDEYLAGQLQAESANDIKGNFEKLARRHTDYFVTAYYPGMTYLIQERRLNEFKVLQPYVTQTRNYVGWARNSACSAYRQDFEAALAEMEKSGRIQEILKINLEAWKNNRLPLSK